MIRRVAQAGWPVIVALLFAAYSAGLLWNAFEAQREVRAEVDARLAADSLRRATIIGDAAANFRNEAIRLADSHEINSFLANRALGMSLRYGLMENLGAIEAKFRLILEGNSPSYCECYHQFILFDDDGSVLVNTSRGDTKNDTELTASSGPALLYDPVRQLIIVRGPPAVASPRWQIRAF